MPKKGSEIVDIEVTLVHDTGIAWKVTSHITNRTAWVAHSMGELDIRSGAHVSGSALLTVPTHIAEEKELV